MARRRQPLGLDVSEREFITLYQAAHGIVVVESDDENEDANSYDDNFLELMLFELQEILANAFAYSFRDGKFRYPSIRLRLNYTQLDILRNNLSLAEDLQSSRLKKSLLQRVIQVQRRIQRATTSTKPKRPQRPVRLPSSIEDILRQSQQKPFAS